LTTLVDDPTPGATMSTGRLRRQVIR